MSPSAERVPVGCDDQERRSGKFRRHVQTEAFCACGAEYGEDAWLALPLVGCIKYEDDDNEDEDADRRPIEVRQCPRCRARLAAREPRGTRGSGSRRRRIGDLL